jgi:hypothetical protein
LRPAPRWADRAGACPHRLRSYHFLLLELHPLNCFTSGRRAHRSHATGRAMCSDISNLPTDYTAGIPGTSDPPDPLEATIAASASAPRSEPLYCDINCAPKRRQTPDRRSRGASPHLSHSSTPPSLLVCSGLTVIVIFRRHDCAMIFGYRCGCAIKIVAAVHRRYWPLR